MLSATSLSYEASGCSFFLLRWNWGQLGHIHHMCLEGDSVLISNKKNNYWHRALYLKYHSKQSYIAQSWVTMFPRHFLEPLVSVLSVLRPGCGSPLASWEVFLVSLCLGSACVSISCSLQLSYHSPTGVLLKLPSWNLWSEGCVSRTVSTMFGGNNKEAWGFLKQISREFSFHHGKIHTPYLLMPTQKLGLSSTFLLPLWRITLVFPKGTHRCNSWNHLLVCWTLKD